MANFSNTIPNRELIKSIMSQLNEIDAKIENHETTRNLGPSRGPLWLNQELKAIDALTDTLLDDCTDYFGP